MTDPEFDPAKIPSDRQLLEQINAKLDWLRWYAKSRELDLVPTDTVTKYGREWAVHDPRGPEPSWPGNPPLQPVHPATESDEPKP